MSPGLLFLLRIDLAIQGLLCFQTHFVMAFSSSVKNIVGILIGVALILSIPGPESSSTAFPDHQQEAELEVEQSGTQSSSSTECQCHTWRPSVLCHSAGPKAAFLRVGNSDMMAAASARHEAM